MDGSLHLLTLNIEASRKIHEFQGGARRRREFVTITLPNYLFKLQLVLSPRYVSGVHVSDSEVHVFCSVFISSLLYCMTS
jgi:hypothetical protein